MSDHGSIKIERPRAGTELEVVVDGPLVLPAVVEYDRVDTTTITIAIIDTAPEEAVSFYEPELVMVDLDDIRHPKVHKAPPRNRQPVSAYRHVAQQTPWVKSGDRMARWSGLPKMSVSTAARWLLPSSLGTAIAAAGMAAAAVFVLMQQGLL